MDSLRRRRSQRPLNIGQRARHALPSVLLGTLFNVLDAGLLMFPSDDGGNTFRSAQIQGMSMYIMSTFLSQVAMTLGGSRFPGALGAMLIEILPFLRGIASDIRQVLGEDSLALVPTVVAAYALTSLLIGGCFILLGVLRAGRLVAYFPQTVLVGAIGGIGVSLFILGLGLPMPPSAASLTLSNAGALLFRPTHVPLLCASVGPALVLSLSMRSETMKHWTYGFTQNAYYVPVFLASVPVLFWITVAGLNLANTHGMEILVSEGWLFQVEGGLPSQSTGLGTGWRYWSLFNFRLVEWHALRNAVVNLVLVVVIGVLNLPIYVPALAYALEEPYSMDHELIGQGIANLLAGGAGTAPNILQLSYSVFFTRAGGGRLEAATVTLFTFVLFLVSPLLLPYVPTILASALVLFLGTELALEAVWEGPKTMLPTEFLVVVSTLVACTFVGFAPGFGIGIGGALLELLFWRVVDAYQGRRSLWPKHFRAAYVEQTTTAVAHSLSTSEEELRVERVEAERNAAKTAGRVIVLQGHIFFGKVPALEKLLARTRSSDTASRVLVLDMAGVHRVETSALQTIARHAKDSRRARLVLCGVEVHSGVHWDFARAGVELSWLEPDFKSCLPDDQVVCFTTRGAANEWVSTGGGGQGWDLRAAHARERDNIQSTCSLVEVVEDGKLDERQVDQVHQLLKDGLPCEGEPDASGALQRLEAVGLAFEKLEPGSVLIERGQRHACGWLVVKGQLALEGVDIQLPKAARLAVRSLAVRFFTAMLLRLPKAKKAVEESWTVYVKDCVGPGGAVGLGGAGSLGPGRLDNAIWKASDRVRVSPAGGACWVVRLPRGRNDEGDERHEEERD